MQGRLLEKRLLHQQLDTLTSVMSVNGIWPQNLAIPSCCLDALHCKLLAFKHHKALHTPQVNFQNHNVFIVAYLSCRGLLPDLSNGTVPAPCDAVGVVSSSRKGKRQHGNKHSTAALSCLDCCISQTSTYGQFAHHKQSSRAITRQAQANKFRFEATSG
jgi:hypothetical protein